LLDAEPTTTPTPPQSLGQTLWAIVKEIIIVVVMASVLSFVIKTWVVQAFYIPSGSMEDTLVKDDRVIVSKLTPGPFDLQRGDIVVFEDPGAPANPWITEPAHAPRSGLRAVTHNALTFVGLLPDDSENHLIKRIIGLPGDHVTCDGSGPIKVNGVAVNETYLKPGSAPSAMAFDITVPQGKVWVMGDNRSDSADSRFHPVGGDGSQGSVPIDKITGRAIVLVWPLDRWTGLGQPTEVFSSVPAGKSP
jgi:signal peptidase I